MMLFHPAAAGRVCIHSICFVIGAHLHCIVLRSLALPARSYCAVQVSTASDPSTRSARKGGGNMKFSYGKIFLLGFGFFGVSVIWGVYNAFVPIFLANKFGLEAAFIGFFM